MKTNNYLHHKNKDIYSGEKFKLDLPAGTLVIDTKGLADKYEFIISQEVFKKYKMKDKELQIQESILILEKITGKKIILEEKQYFSDEEIDRISLYEKNWFPTYINIPDSTPGEILEVLIWSDPNTDVNGNSFIDEGLFWETSNFTNKGNVIIKNYISNNKNKVESEIIKNFENERLRRMKK